MPDDHISTLLDKTRSSYDSYWWISGGKYACVPNPAEVNAARDSYSSICLFNPKSKIFIKPWWNIMFWGFKS